MGRWLALGFVAAGALAACVSDSSQINCTDYCQTVIGECKDDDAQYVFKTGGSDPLPACLAICSHFPQERTGGSNSIACRKSAASSASEVRTDKAMHHQRCVDAGPFSAMCGGTVANFCKVTLAICPGMPFASEAACNTSFAMVSKDAFDTTGINDPVVPAQNSKLCRFYHVEKATEDAVTHCPHTNSPASPVCTQ